MTPLKMENKGLGSFLALWNTEAERIASTVPVIAAEIHCIKAWILYRNST